MKAVFDTNIFVSAFIFRDGRAAQALTVIVEGGARLIISKPIILEVLDVLSRKFGRDKEELAKVAVFLAELGEIVQPRSRIKALNDEADNRILECASVGNAEVIVTGDKAMLRLGEYKGIRIVSLSGFLGEF